MKVKYFILSKLHKHALAVLEETDTTITIHKLKVVNEIVLDEDREPQIEQKNGLTTVFEDVDITKDYWTVYEYMTGIKPNVDAIIV